MTQVHPVGERVGELGRDRTDLATQPAEVVEQPRALRRQLLEQACEAQHIHTPSLRSRRASDSSLTRCQSRLWHRTCLVWSAGGWPAELLRRRAPFLRFEPALARGPCRLRRDPPALDFQRLPELLHEPLDGQLAVAPLTALVLRDRAQGR